jgi:glycosyltransferase involved in cell wall biosynthesis
MKVGYFLNTYPVPSATFIRREIEALEVQGQTVLRFAARRFSEKLVDQKDIAEAEKTVYILEGKLSDLTIATIRELLLNPVGIIKALPTWRKLVTNSGGGFARHAAYLMQAASFRQKASRAGIDHAHAHYGTNAAAVVMLARLMGGPQYSFTAHGPDEFIDTSANSYALKIRHASFVVAISNYCRSVLRDLSQTEEDRKKIEIARCGLNLEDFKPSAPITADNFNIVCVGRLCPQKGQVHIPAAAAALRDEFPSLRITLIGDGESRAEIEAEIARHGVGEQVILKGWASNEEVRTFIATSRALLLPSYHEGLPIVLMEGMALQRPVITTTIAAIPELVDDKCGWLVPPGDHVALVSALRDALSASPERLAEMGQEGRMRVERMHDIKSLASDLSRLFGRKS